MPSKIFQILDDVAQHPVNFLGGCLASWFSMLYSRYNLDTIKENYDRDPPLSSSFHPSKIIFLRLSCHRELYHIWGTTGA
jgi:hypothetical protein